MPTPRKSISLTLIVCGQVAAMSLWFSASAAVPNLLAKGQLTSQAASLLTAAVQLGFVAGTLISARFGVADRFDPRRLFSACAMLGASANTLLLWIGLDHALTPMCRFITGMAMAGIYPVGMKLAAVWAQGNIGALMGALVGAVSVGSALPHLFVALSDLDWHIPLASASVCAVVAAVAMAGVSLGPRHAASARFEPRKVWTMLRRPALLWANAGYLGHMWELYAMWAWIGSFLLWASAQPAQAGVSWWGTPAMSTFVVIATGGLGCLMAGVMADRVGRTTVTMGAMACSGACAATIGWWVDVGPLSLMIVALLWGLTVVADSAQFSASVAELSDPDLVGTALTVQTSLGFLLTFFVIQVMPGVVDRWGWSQAFAVLAVGPALGVWAMWRLRRSPDSVKLAQGKR